MRGLHELRKDILLKKFNHVKGEIGQIKSQERQFFSSILSEIEKRFGELPRLENLFLKTGNKEFYKSYLSKLDDIEVLIDQYLEMNWYLYETYKYQHEDPKLKKELHLIESFVEKILTSTGAKNDLLVILGSVLSVMDSIGMEEHEFGRFFFIPFFERENYLLWPLFPHELGHAFYDQKRPIFEHFYEEMSKVVKRDFIKTPGEESERKREEQLRRFKTTWHDWMLEIFADIYGVLTLGPAFLFSYLHQNLCANPYRLLENEMGRYEHPPHIIRTKIHFSVLKGIIQNEIIMEVVEDLERKYDLYEQNVAEPESTLYQMLVCDDLINASIKECENIPRIYVDKEEKIASELDSPKSTLNEDPITALNVIWLKKLTEA
ncbi:MAG TPA: hypothetical protein VMW67_00575 [Desulfobacteria bacterium]|nr:hypothetical protein [Desulfobacteria bacterium]